MEYTGVLVGLLSGGRNIFRVWDPIEELFLGPPGVLRTRISTHIPACETQVFHKHGNVD